jgi:hypothetical protein
MPSLLTSYYFAELGENGADKRLGNIYFPIKWSILNKTTQAFDCLRFCCAVNVFIVPFSTVDSKGCTLGPVIFTEFRNSNVCHTILKGI